RLGHVARHEVDAIPLVAIQQQVEPMGILLEVVDPDLPAPLDQLLGHPRPDTAVAARHQDAHAGISGNGPVSALGQPIRSRVYACRPSGSSSARMASSAA